MKVSKAAGVQLNWMVAKAAGLEIESIQTQRSGNKYLNVYITCPLTGEKESTEVWEPTTAWSQGGPLILTGCIGLLPSGNAWFERDGGAHYSYGETHLISAMRAFVTSVLGSEVAIPKELE